MQRHASSGGRASDRARLARLLRETPHDAPPALARSVGRELAALAYAVLVNRGVAEAVVAGVLASAVRRSSAGSPPASGRALWVALCGETLRSALAAYAATREVDPRATTSVAARRSLTPQQRAAAAGTILGELSAVELSAALEVPERRAQMWLRDAEVALGSVRALTEHVRSLALDTALSVSEAQVRHALDAPPARAARPAIWRWALAVPLSAALIVVAAALLSRPPAREAGAGGPPGGTEQAAAAVASSTPDAVARAGGEAGTVTTGPGLSLADCRIQPASSELAFRGWLMLSDLTASDDPAGATVPVYALVTRGVAEWVGWQTSEGRPMFPRPVGRLACAVDPATSTATVFAMPDSWEPPTLVDGCPASPLLRHGGDLQIGGPGAFALLPIGDDSWWANDPSVRILARITPAPRAGDQISAWAIPLGRGRELRLGIDSAPLAADRPSSSSHYVWLTGAHFAHAGCWLVSVAIDGEPVGRAVLPVSRRPG